MDGQIVILILGMAIVSYLPRALPLLLFSRAEFPPWLVKWLGFIPAAVLAALLVPDLFLPEGQLLLTYRNPYLLSALPTLLIAVITKSMIWALVGGMGCFALLQLWL
ncbi:MAG TPA: AzlD domain-containing protein [Clostridia bacterium]|nr:AzlD domain-containing protein [Clostridia bacterium]